MLALGDSANSSVATTVFLSGLAAYAGGWAAVNLQIEYLERTDHRRQLSALRVAIAELHRQSLQVTGIRTRYLEKSNASGENWRPLGPLKLGPASDRIDLKEVPVMVEAMPDKCELVWKSQFSYWLYRGLVDERNRLFEMHSQGATHVAKDLPTLTTYLFEKVSDLEEELRQAEDAATMALEDLKRLYR